MNNSKTTAYLMESISAQAKLMNGNNQFSEQEDRDAAETLKMQIDFEKFHGNKRLLKIYRDALARLEARL